MKKIIFLLCLAAFLFLFACSRPITSESDGKITVIVSDGEVELFNGEISFEKGNNLVDLLKNHDQIAMKGNLQQYGFYIDEMCGLRASSNSWWNIKINGADAEVGISSIELKDQDVIAFTLTDLSSFN
ncbi:MAG: DUF4430 domain-containing protein [Acholeplasmataceae bacterium]|nr:DUF4430 domain-containing protein [Acholeplasmataceae bacterium]